MTDLEAVQRRLIDASIHVGATSFKMHVMGALMKAQLWEAFDIVSNLKVPDEGVEEWATKLREERITEALSNAHVEGTHENSEAASE